MSAEEFREKAAQRRIPGKGESMGALLSLIACGGRGLTQIRAFNIISKHQRATQQTHKRSLQGSTC